TVTRWFVVGDGSAGAIATARDAIQGMTTGTVRGTVTSDGQPLADVDVAVIAPTLPGQPSINVIDHFRTAVDGSYEGTLAPGTYTVRVNKEGRPFGSPDPATITIAASTTTVQDFTMPATGSLEVDITDADGAPLTAKVQLVGFDPSPKPVSEQDIAGA